MRRVLVFGAVAWATALQGCKTTQLYPWGNYDEALYAHYKHPQKRDEFVAELKKVVDAADARRLKAPPGCYAEYGYEMLEEGRRTEAATYFKKERDAWPESRAFMDKMIAVAGRTPLDPAKAPATQDSPGKAPATQNPSAAAPEAKSL
jgi:hypothetical protein